jgi:membrane-bound lytic murein transglycosylase D
MNKKYLISSYLLLVAQLSMAQDSIPTTAALPIPVKKTVLKFKEDKGELDKYAFKPVFATNKKITGATTSVISSFNSQQTAGLTYSLNLEAQEFIQNYRRKNETELLRMKGWGAYYLSSMENILMQHGIPKQLVYLAVIETHLNVNLVSWTNAVGMWQFMAETGRMYGLQVGNGIDERYDWYKSTHAAAEFLKDLYKSFNDWLLVVAAYNGGPGRVYSAIKRSGSKNFWELQYYLPKESSNHVKKFIGTQYIMEGNTNIAGISSFDEVKPKKYFNPLEKGAVAVDTSKGMMDNAISGRYNSLIIAKYILMDIATFNIINPNFDAQLAINNSTYNLRLPQDKMQLFKANQLQIMNESLQLFLTLNGVGNMTEDIKPMKIKKGKRKY